MIISKASVMKIPGQTIVYNPFDISNVGRYQVYWCRIGSESMSLFCPAYNDISSECFMTTNPYPSYRIQEYDILLKPFPSVCYYNGILWKYDDEYYMFINYNGDIILTKNYAPGEFLDPAESFREMEYWNLGGAGVAVNQKTFAGKHFKDPKKNITVVKEFPRWVRRDDGVPYWYNVPCGYYDPVDGANGVIQFGQKIENSDEELKKWSCSYKAIQTFYLGEALTWKK